MYQRTKDMTSGRPGDCQTNRHKLCSRIKLAKLREAEAGLGLAGQAQRLGEGGEPNAPASREGWRADWALPLSWVIRGGWTSLTLHFLTYHLGSIIVMTINKILLQKSSSISTGNPNGIARDSFTRSLRAYRKEMIPDGNERFR